MDCWMWRCFSVTETHSHSSTDHGTPHLHTAFLVVHGCFGSVLAHRKDNKEHVIAYASNKLRPPERKWSTFDRKLWAIVWSVRHFKHFLAGSSFTVITYHKPLLSLRKAPVDNDPTGWMCMTTTCCTLRVNDMPTWMPCPGTPTMRPTTKLFSVSSPPSAPAMTPWPQVCLTSATHCQWTLRGCRKNKGVGTQTLCLCILKWSCSAMIIFDPNWPLPPASWSSPP